MSVNKVEIRYLLKFYFKKGKNATQAAKEICEVYGPETVSNRTAREWFTRFRAGNFDVKDAHRAGRPATEKKEDILRKVEQDPHTSTYDIANELDVCQKTVYNRLEKAGFRKTGDGWVPKDVEDDIDGL